MPLRSFICRLAGLIGCLGVIVVVSPRSMRAENTEPSPVTSDTPEYCLHLLDEVSQMVRFAGLPPPPEVTSLSTEGQRMCTHGQTRAGIARLRRAWVLMRKHDGMTP